MKLINTDCLLNPYLRPVVHLDLVIGAEVLIEPVKLHLVALHVPLLGLLQLDDLLLYFVFGRLVAQTKSVSLVNDFASGGCSFISLERAKSSPVDEAEVAHNMIAGRLVQNKSDGFLNSFLSVLFVHDSV